jgi:murein DD-endopeptidase MepM/ murein hydrolase activator NlpD
MRRFAPVAAAFAFAALLATPVLARPSEIPTRSHEWSGRDRDSDDEMRDRRRQRSVERDDEDEARERRRRRSVQHARKRTTAKPAAHAAYRAESPIAGRAVTAQAGGGLGRSCLTPATRALLGRIESKFGHVQIISTCRPGAVIASTGRRSKHASGQAIDFTAPSGRKGEVVRWLVANHKSGGIMTYNGMSHIHVDIGYHFVSLNSGHGG